MEEVSPYSMDVVFLAQLVIITIYSPCSEVKCTISNATIRAPQTETHTHLYRDTLHSPHKMHMHVNSNKKNRNSILQLRL